MDREQELKAQITGLENQIRPLKEELNNIWKQKAKDVECEDSCKHSDWIDLYYSSGDLYGRYCNDCGEFFE